MITTATSATVVNDNRQELIMRLRDGLRDETVADEPGQSNISTFTTTDMPLALKPQSDVHLGRVDTALYAMPMSALLVRIHELSGKPDAKRYLIEMYNRFALPVACLVLMLVGVPLGVNSRRGGKSSGFVFTILLVFVYYFLSSTGMQLGHQSRLPAFIAVWAGQHAFCCGRHFFALADGDWRANLRRYGGVGFASAEVQGSGQEQWVPAHRASRQVAAARAQIQTTRRFSAHPGRVHPARIRHHVRMVLAGFVLLMIVFTFFDLVGDILRNHIALFTVGDYLLNLTPSMLYHIAPLAVLIAALVTFGVLNRNSEIVAIKATGISLYRLVVPISDHGRGAGGGLVSLRPVLSAAGQPQTGGAAQHHQRPAARRPTCIPSRSGSSDQDRCPASPGAFTITSSSIPIAMSLPISPCSSSTRLLFDFTRRIFAKRAVWSADAGEWDFENGWVRDIQGANVTDYRTS